jgi:hypothetical protein
MIPEELEDNEDVQKLTQEYTEGEIKFSEFQERLDFIAENGYDKEDKPGRVLLDGISEAVYNYEKENIPSGKEFIVINHEQRYKILNSEDFMAYRDISEGIEDLFGYDIEIDENADNTPKIVEQNSYEYQPESETPLLDETKMF